MTLPEHEYYTFEQLAERWAEHGVSEKDLVHYGELGKLKLSIYILRCRAIAFVPIMDENNTPISEYSVGTCDISGVFGFDNNQLPDVINGETNRIHTVHFDRPQKISRWSTERPRELGDLYQKICREWKPAELSECEQRIWRFHIVPPEFLLLAGDNLVKTSDLDSELFTHLKNTLETSDYKYEQSFSYSDLRVTSDAVAMFEKKYLKSNEIDQEMPVQRLAQNRREDWLLRYLNNSDYPTSREGRRHIEDRTQAQLWQALNLYSKDEKLFPVDRYSDSSVKKFFRVQKFCYWKD